MILVTGGGGAIAGHLVKALLDEGNQVRAVDIKPLPEWWQVHEYVENIAGRDLRTPGGRNIGVFGGIDTVYHLAASMGGMGYLGDKENDKAVLIDNARIDMNCFEAAAHMGVKRFIYASSACVYPERLQMETGSRALREEDAYPAWPDLEYGWQKLYSERQLAAWQTATFLPLAVRFHNVYGPWGSWTGGREKAPAAMCRKVAVAKMMVTPAIEVWGDGQARRSYLYVDDCVKGLMMLAETNETEPINLGSERSVSVDELATIVAGIAEWPVEIRHVTGPEGVRGRNANIDRLRRVLGWEPQVSLEDGLRAMYAWVEEKVRAGS